MKRGDTSRRTTKHEVVTNKIRVALSDVLLKNVVVGATKNMEVQKSECFLGWYLGRVCCMKCTFDGSFFFETKRKLKPKCRGRGVG